MKTFWELAMLVAVGVAMDLTTDLFVWVRKRRVEQPVRIVGNNGATGPLKLPK